ncbi:hypothetical protein Poly30_21490 [Planctomycetes bacterium Poly30]|uniref:Uncharacterized protein n=1 Tax=Saltatorellus ferox TaxID=2528018 RepID=A0A518ERB6_9BACT|nr:hypothetical protein Poly30_21490 [Planctomycetes bacterium Poly30]
MKSNAALQDAQQLDLFGERANARSAETHRSQPAKLSAPASHEIELRPGRRVRRVRQVSSSLLTFKGFEAERSLMVTPPEPAQLAGGAASSLVSLKHGARTQRSAPKHACPKRVRRIAKAAAPRALPVMSQEIDLQAPALRPLSSAALSYVFVAVTLACTFLV